MPNFRIYMYTSIAILMLKIREGGALLKFHAHWELPHPMKIHDNFSVQS